jgi:hypothetical protein
MKDAVEHVAAEAKARSAQLRHGDDVWARLPIPLMLPVSGQAIA